jgi:signal transduction histidine kinase
MSTPKRSSTPKRFFLISGILFAIIFLVIAALTWTITQRQVLDQLQKKLIASAEAIDRNITAVINDTESQCLRQGEELAQTVQAGGYFQAIYLLDGQGRYISGLPTASAVENDLSSEDLTRIHSILTGVDADIYVVRTEEQTANYLTFLVAIHSNQGALTQIHLCRSILADNPAASSLLAEMNTIDQGMSLLRDNFGQAIYYSPLSQNALLTNQTMIMTSQILAVRLSDGTSGYAYSKAISMEPWIVTLFVPNSYVSSHVLQIILPINLIVVATLIAILLGVYWQLQKAFAKIDGYSQRILGNVHPVGEGKQPSRMSSELGRLQYALASIKEKLDVQLEEQRMLKEIAAFFIELDGKSEVFHALAELLIKRGASSVRFCFSDPLIYETIFHHPIAMHWGPDAESCAAVEDQVIALVQKQDPLFIPNLARSRQLQAKEGVQLPAALAAFRIKGPGEYFGTFWLAYNDPQLFGKEDIEFLADIAEEIGKGIVKSRKMAYMQNERTLLQHGLDSISQPFMIYHPSTGVIFANKPLLHLEKVLHDEYQFTTLDKAIRNPTVAEFLQRVDPVEKSTILELNGTCFQLTKYALQEGDQDSGWVCLFNDITGFKEKEKNQLEFFNLVSHDLRSPMTLISGYVNMLEMVGSVNDQQKNYIAKINGNIDNMNSLINSVLDMGRLEGGAEIQLGIVNPQEVLEEAIKSLQPVATQKNIRLVHEKGENGVFRADRILIEQALKNLIENAIQYSSVGNVVDVKITSDVSHVTFIIEDHGVGISPIDLPKLFSKPKLISVREGRSEKAGLGLVLVKSIVDRHHGIIRAESKLGKGSTFTMEIPRGIEGKTEK